MDLSRYIFTASDKTQWKYYKNSQGNYWTADELDFTEDALDYKKASPSIKRAFRIIFAIFVHLDGLIAHELVRFLESAARENNWAKFYYYTFQIMMENTHSETYVKAAETIIGDDKEFEEVKKMVKDSPIIRKKGEWANIHIHEEKDENLANVARAVTEGIHFISLFAIIFRFRMLDIFKTFITGNEFISKDEKNHRDQACSEVGEVKREDGIKIIKEGTELEIEFLQFMLSEPIVSKQADEDIGLTVENVTKYIKTLADHISDNCGFGIIYGERVDLIWMKQLGLTNKNNFHEITHTADYSTETGTAQLKDPDSFDW
jgi:ribonucleoside-diphosphate reductase beta chain